MTFQAVKRASDGIFRNISTRMCEEALKVNNECKVKGIFEA